MNLRTIGRRAFSAAVLSLGLALSFAARADVIVERNVLVSNPTMPLVEELGLTSAGMLTVSVTDLSWPVALQSLSFAISDAQAVLAQRDQAGTLSYMVSGPMTLFANIFAAPDRTSGVGLYHLNVSFAPSVVPLPPAVWLLMSGLGLLFGIRQRR